MIEKLTTITELPVDDIIVEDRLRVTSPDGVANLVEAIRESGFTGSIQVRRKKDGDYLIDGAHRLAAMKEIGAKTIPVEVIRCSDLDARLMEIDANLMGQPMSALDDAYFMAQRREFIQKKHPELRQGAAGAAARWMQLHFSALAKTIAASRGIKVRQVYNIMAAGASLSREEYERLSLTSSIKLSDLSGIRKITAPEERSFVIEALAEGKAATVKAARKAYLAATGAAPAPLSDSDQKLARLMDAWDRAGKSARVGFLSERYEAVAALLDEIGREDRT